MKLDFPNKITPLKISTVPRKTQVVDEVIEYEDDITLLTMIISLYMLSSNLNRNIREYDKVMGKLLLQ